MIIMGVCACWPKCENWGRGSEFLFLVYFCVDSSSFRPPSLSFPPAPPPNVPLSRTKQATQAGSLVIRLKASCYLLLVCFMLM